MYKLISNQRDFLIISKDAGVSFHKENNQDGLLERIKSDLHLNRLYSVHRLDRMTSGLLVFAKNSDTARELSHRFSRRMVEKYYLAISDCRPRKKQGTVKGDMVRSRRGSWKLTRSMEDPSITGFFSYALHGGLRLFLLRPCTGKTHQLRVAMKSLGAPVLGDETYHRKEKNKPADRGYLHSYILIFELGGVSYRFQQRPDRGVHFLSETFIEVLKKCERPWELKWPCAS